MTRSPLGIALVAVLVAACGPGARSSGAPAPSATAPVSPPTTAATALPSAVPPSPATTSPSPPRCTNATAVTRWSLARRAAQVVAVPVKDFDVRAAAPEIAAGAGGVLFLGSAAPPRDLGHRLRMLGARAPGVRPLVIGIVHGLAGSAAVALLVLATIHNPVWAIGYLLLFGIGTIAGMMLMTAVIARRLRVIAFELHQRPILFLAAAWTT